MENFSKEIVLDNEQATSKTKSLELMIIGTLRNTSINSEDLDELIWLISSQPEQKIYLNIKIVLFEIKKDYAQAFKCLLQSVTEQHKVFDWLKTIFISLKEQGHNDSDFN